MFICVAQPSYIIIVKQFAESAVCATDQQQTHDLKIRFAREEKNIIRGYRNCSFVADRRLRNDFLQPHENVVNEYKCCVCCVRRLVLNAIDVCRSVRSFGMG